MPPVSEPSSEDIDRYGDLDLQLALFAPVREEHELLKAKLEAGLAGRPGDLPSVLDGRRYQLQLTARRNERTITDKKSVFNLLKKRIGIDGFLALISIPLGEGVDRNTVKSEQAKFLKEERSGSRSIKVVAKRPAPAA
jgi:hypothetical protein